MKTIVFEHLKSTGFLPQAFEPLTETPGFNVNAVYMSGICKELKANGVGSDCTPGDANYTSARDRDFDLKAFAEVCARGFAAAGDFGAQAGWEQRAG